jgi:uncharacterized membrane protein YhhN
MNTLTAVLLGLTLGVAVVDWWAVNDPGRRRVELVAKPLTLVVLIGAALALDPVDPTVRAWFVIALVLSLAGDVFLMLDEKWFVAGLGAFLLGHIAYIVGFWVSGEIDGDRLAVGVALVLIGLATVGRTIMRGIRATQPEMTVPVTAYMLVISVMVLSAIGTGNPWAVVGSLLFYASDALIAVNRFIEPQPWGRLAIITTYHLGQIGLVLSLV